MVFQRYHKLSMVIIPRYFTVLRTSKCHKKYQLILKQNKVYAMIFHARYWYKLIQYGISFKIKYHSFLMILLKSASDACRVLPEFHSQSLSGSILFMDDKTQY